MGNVIDGTKALLGRGKVYFNPWTALNVPTGYLFLGNTPAFEMTPTQEEIKKYGSTTAAAKLMASDVLRSEIGLKITADHFNKELLGLALFGTAGTAITQSASTVADEAVNDVLQDRSYRLAKRKVSSVVVTDATPTTYTVTTDYTVDAETGMIYIVPGGTIANGTDLLVDYSYAAITSYPKVNLGAEGVKRGSILFIPDNARGPQMEHTLWRVTLRSSGAIGFISDQYAEYTLEGYVEDDSANHASAPFGETVYREA
jgi:hypothetical protein